MQHFKMFERLLEKLKNMNMKKLTFIFSLITLIIINSSSSKAAVINVL